MRMERTVLFGITLLLVSNTFSLPAFSQAIAESVTLGAATSIAGTKAGSALGSALSRSSKQIAGHLQQQVSQPQPRRTPKATRALLPKSQSQGISTTTSIGCAGRLCPRSRTQLQAGAKFTAAGKSRTRNAVHELHQPECLSQTGVYEVRVGGDGHFSEIILKHLSSAIDCSTRSLRFTLLNAVPLHTISVPSLTSLISLTRNASGYHCYYHAKY